MTNVIMTQMLHSSEYTPLLVNYQGVSPHQGSSPAGICPQTGRWRDTRAGRHLSWAGCRPPSACSSSWLWESSRARPPPPSQKYPPPPKHTRVSNGIGGGVLLGQCCSGFFGSVMFYSCVDGNIWFYWVSVALVPLGCHCWVSADLLSEPYLVGQTHKMVPKPADPTRHEKNYIRKT